MVIKSQEARAVVEVAGIVTGITIGITAIKLAFTYISLNVLATIGMVILLLGALYFLYIGCLEQIKRDDKIQQLAQNYKVDQK